MGSKKRPYYRIVASDARAPRDGRFLEIIGVYDPLIKEGNKFELNQEKLSYWLSVGAKPTERVATFIKKMKMQGG
jgi:small subunit ribosomal protein S16